MKTKDKKDIKPKTKKSIKNNSTFKKQYFEYYNDIKTVPKQDW